MLVVYFLGVVINFAHEGVGNFNDYLSTCLPSPTRNGRKKTPRHYVDNEILS